jgi:hypothetical protein
MYRGTELGSVVTDVGGRFVIDVDRNPVSQPRRLPSLPSPPPEGLSGVDALVASPLIVSSGGELVLHNYAAIPTHEHWTVELRVEKQGFRTGHVKVDVPRDLSKEPIKLRLLPR